MLTDAQSRDLKAFAGTMIPASARHGVPGSDDDAIFADLVKTLDIRRDRDHVVAALKRLSVLAGKPFADIAAGERLAIANKLRAEGGIELAALTRVVLLAYYRDDRVMRSLDQEPRAPFPKGHVVEQGDWSLLDKVKERKPFWRDVK